MNDTIEPPSVSLLLTSAFEVARGKRGTEHKAWVTLSFRLSGRFNLPIASVNIQRLGDLDVLLRCIENEFDANRAAQGHCHHYQLMLSELWVVGWYEILRAFRQRDRDSVKAGTPTSGVTEMDLFKAVLADLELLRMPMAKFEIAKDDKLEEPLAMWRVGETGEGSPEFYDAKDPSRSHIMPTGLGSRGSVLWKALDHQNGREYWVERRDLSDRLLALGEAVVRAGILEVRERD